MIRCCGTCARWDLGRQIGRDFFLGGQCYLDEKERSADEMTGCLGWKQPTSDQIQQRLSVGKIKKEDIHGD